MRGMLFLVDMWGVEIVRVDERGRILIPKKIRERVNVKEGVYVSVKVEGRSVVIQPVEPVAEKFFGAFKIARWPDDLDEFMVRLIGGADIIIS